LIASHDAEDFADSIVSVLSNSELMEKLRRGAVQSGSRYTMEAMVNNFKTGIKHCLALGGKLAPAMKRDLFVPENES
jgi:hypothetical protein